MKKRWYGLVVVALTAVLFTTGAKPVKIAPSFSLQDYAGQPHQLAEWRGQPTLLNFWASWCGYCRAEMPELVAIQRRYAGQLHVVGINLAHQGDDPARSAAFLKQQGVTYVNLLDRTGAVSDHYDVQVVPTNVLLDAEGRVVQRLLGPITMKQLAPLLAKLGVVANG